MKQFASIALASLILVSACKTEKAIPPAPPPAAPAQPAVTPPVKPIEPAKPVAEAQKPADAPSIVEVEKPAAPAKPAEVAKPAETAQPVEPAKPAEAPKPAEVAKPVEPAKPAETATPMPDAPKPPAETTKPPVEAPKPAAKVNMDADIKTLMAKPEVADQNIEIQHILIAFKGSGVPTATRTKEEAKALAEKVYAEVMAGGNFDALVKQYTNDSHPGIYPMTKAGRARMVKGFGDVGFRLNVGDVGVAPWEAAASPYGWHIIKRLK